MASTSTTTKIYTSSSPEVLAIQRPPAVDWPTFALMAKHIDFKFFNMTIEFVDVDMEGFKTFTLEKSTVDRTGR